MKFKTTLWLLAVICVLGAFIRFIERRARTTPEGMEESPLGWRPSPENMNYLLVERGALLAECVKKNRTWLLQRPMQTKADESQIDRIIAELERMPKGEVITPAQMAQRELTLEDYGLVKPRARLIVGERLARTELLIGCDAPLGNMLYVKTSDSDAVISTSRAVLDALPGKIYDIRDKTIVRGDAARTKRLELTRRGVGFVQLTQSACQWIIQQPLVARADNRRVAQILDALYAGRIDSFVYDPPTKEAGPAGTAEEKIPGGAGARGTQYGLSADEAAVLVTVWVEGDEVGKELVLGKPAGDQGKSVYAKTGDSDTIFTVGTNMLAAFSVTLNDLRSRNLFSIGVANVKYACFKEGDTKLALQKKKETGWTIVEPAQWKADDQGVNDAIQKVTGLKIESFLDESATNLAALGLAPPAYVIQLAGEYAPAPTNAVAPAAPAAPAGMLTLLVGTQPEAGGPICVKFDNDKSVFTVLPEGLKSLGKHPADPLLFRDRSMLAVPVESVRRISVVKGGVEQAVARNESDAWAPVASTTNRVDRQVVEDVLLLVCNLRALRIEAVNPADLTAYGLDGSGLTLKLGLSGGEGIQKSILTGFRARTDGIYAMVQGQDVVFVLGNDIVNRLTRDLLKAPAAADRKP